MRSFEGFLDDFEILDRQLVVRLSVGGFDPSPADSPILYVVVEQPCLVEQLTPTLRSLKETGDGVYLDQVSDKEVVLFGDHDTEVRLVGLSIAFREAEYEPRDFKRLAEQNHQWAKDLNESLRNMVAKDNQMRTLIHQQLGRLSAKADWHPAESTQHKLHEQQIQFLVRLLEAGDG